MNTWRTDKPTPHKYVYVWDGIGTATAYWSGKVWRTEDNQPVQDVTHWREMPVTGVTSPVSGVAKGAAQ